MSVLLRMCPGDGCGLLVANVLVQVTVVTLAALLLARLGSRWNAAVRHSIYVVAITCVLVSPLLTLLMQESGISFVSLRPAEPDVAAEPAKPAAIPVAHVVESGPIEVSTPALAQTPLAENLAHLQIEAENPGQVALSGNTPPLSLPDMLRAIAAVALNAVNPFAF